MKTIVAVAVSLSLGCGLAAAQSAVKPEGKRTDNSDGSAKVSVWLNMPAMLSTKFGTDFSLNSEASVGSLPNSAPLAARQPDAAWAQLPLNGAARQLGWDEASVEARAEKGGDDTKLKANVKRVLAKRDGVALTFTQSAAAGRAVAADHRDANATTSLDASSALGLNLAGTGTSFSLGADLPKDQATPKTTLGAEQQLFGGLKISGSVSRAENGQVQTGIGASFKRTW